MQTFLCYTQTQKENTRSRWRLKHLRGKRPPRDQHSTTFSGHNSCESGDINYLTCHMNSQDHMIERSKDMGGNLS